MASRLKLHEKLVALLGTNKVYFQPPESVKLDYPCILYEIEGMLTEHADDVSYVSTRSYTLTYITLDPDDPLIDEISHLPLCRLSRTYSTQGINHYVYTLYY